MDIKNCNFKNPIINKIYHIFLHVIFIFIFLTIFFFLYVGDAEKKSFKTQINLVVDDIMNDIDIKSFIVFSNSEDEVLILLL